VLDASYGPHGASVTDNDAPGGLPRAQVYLFDATNRLKYVPHVTVREGDQVVQRHARTGREFFEAGLQRDVAAAYNCGPDRGTSVYLALDTGSPPNKAMEHERRQKGVTPMSDPAPDAPPLVDEFTLPMPEEWRSFIANKRARLDLLAYVTRAFLGDYVAGLPTGAFEPDITVARRFTFLPPPDCVFYLHGGSLDDRRTAAIDAFGRPELPPVLHYVEHAQQPIVVGGMHSREFQRTAGEVDAARAPPERVARLLEGEMACLYYATLHPDEDCCFVSPDGDMLLQLLLFARDRLDPQTRTFRNRHYLVLRMPQSTDVVVDINRLYLDIAADARLQRAGVNEPVATLCALGTLAKNDFIHRFAPGVGSFRASGSDLYEPFALHVLFAAPEQLAGLLRVGGARAPHVPPLAVHVDEACFLSFCDLLYVTKYRERTAKDRKCHPDSVTAAMVREYLAARSSKNYMMEPRVARVYARQLAWVMLYWHNGYRGDCVVESPFATYAGLPYYGWEKTSHGCAPAERVSVARERAHEVAAARPVRPPSPTPAAGLGAPPDPARDTTAAPDDTISPDVYRFLRKRARSINETEERARKQARRSLHSSGSAAVRDLQTALDTDAAEVADSADMTPIVRVHLTTTSPAASSPPEAAVRTGPGKRPRETSETEPLARKRARHSLHSSSGGGDVSLRDLQTAPTSDAPEPASGTTGPPTIFTPDHH
jgi:hypothetical protein